MYSAAQRRALLSFPTRRSSDLVAAGRDAGAGLLAAPSRRGGWLEPITAGEGAAVCCQHGTRCRDDQDRKSTRLNSSHGYISYAAFCLTKTIRNRADDDAGFALL